MPHGQLWDCTRQSRLITRLCAELRPAKHSRVSANASWTRRWRRQRARRGPLVRSVLDLPARSRRKGSSAPMPSAQPDVAEASHRRSAGRRRDHRTPTPPGRWRPQRAPSSESAVGRLLLHLGVPHRSIEPPRRSAATSPFPSVQVRSRPARSNPRAACPRVFAHACQHAAPPTAKHRPECAVLPHRTWPSTTPASQSATPRVANLRVVADGLPPSKAQSQ